MAGLDQLHIMPQLPLTLAQIAGLAVEILTGCPCSPGAALKRSGYAP